MVVRISNVSKLGGGGWGDRLPTETLPPSAPFSVSRPAGWERRAAGGADQQPLGHDEATKPHAAEGSAPSRRGHDRDEAAEHQVPSRRAVRNAPARRTWGERTAPSRRGRGRDEAV